ncbi:hypothetical protein MKZ38_010220 [Zalerion maritima]|uniref:Uncharacterized protein n=1 Tax=Zalerion maritima TaxID=339359 RepID=A0AAD5RJM2_9PEZI|nr:hypothetical protein MKZ38_010220 [Zalerion maritima]
MDSGNNESPELDLQTGVASNASRRAREKVVRIGERLGAIEGLLRGLTVSGASPSEMSPGSVGSARFPIPASSTHAGGLTPGPGSGDAAPGVPIDHEQDQDGASSAFEDAVQRTPLKDSSPKMGEALESLKRFVEMQNKIPTSSNSKFPHRKAMAPAGLKALEIPPSHRVVDVFRITKHKPPFVYLMIVCFIPVESFLKLYRKVYFALENFSEAAFITINTDLYYIFFELADSSESRSWRGKLTEGIPSSAEPISRRLWHTSAWSMLPRWKIEALLMGDNQGTYAIKVYRPSVAIPDPSSKALPGVDEPMEWIVQSDEVSYLSWLALVYRATLRGKANRTILYTQFVPFSIMFCHAMEMCDQSAHVSLWSLTEVPYNVANTYIEAKEKALPDQSLLPVGNAFDTYLCQLRFMTNADETMGSTTMFQPEGTVDAANAVPHAGSILVVPAATIGGPMGGPIGGWFSGNNYMMELTEEGGFAQFSMQWPSRPA